MIKKKEKGNWLIEFVRPTIGKIIVFFVLFFIAFLSAISIGRTSCDFGGCDYVVADILLFVLRVAVENVPSGKLPGILLPILLVIQIAYLYVLACIFVFLYKLIRGRKNVDH